MKYPINEVFETVQGEGTYTGTPAVFLRLQGCGVGCPWCDTKHTWALDIERETSMSSVMDKKEDSDAWAAMDAEGIVRVVQLTDTHLCRARGGTLLGMDTDHSLQSVIDLVRKERPALDLFPIDGRPCNRVTLPRAQTDRPGWRTFTELFGVTMDPEDIWGESDETKGGFKISNAVKGTRVSDLVTLVGGMGEGTDIVFVATDGFKTTLPYTSIHTTPDIQEHQVFHPRI